MAPENDSRTAQLGDELDDAVEPPRHLGRYRIDGVVGAGGMGIVLRAHDPELDRAVALKVLRRDDDAAQAELLAEAQTMARLRHRNVVAVHDVGTTDGRVYLAMELVPGTTLRAWRRAAPRSWRAICAAHVAAARGLAAAHAAGIVHRDFKPDNVLVDEDGTVRVADFGLAGGHLADAGPGPVTGTPAYMAPEQHAGDPVGPAADQFAFAVALWEALAGERPFTGAGTAELLAAKRRGPPPPPTAAAPRWIFALLRRALAAEPGRRHPSVAALADALERGLGRRRRRLAVAGGVALVVASATAAIVLAGDRRGPDCRLAGDAVERAWGPATRARLTAAFAASSRPHAAATAILVADELDRRAAALADAREGACAATYRRGEQSAAALDRRMTCLDHQLGQLDAVAELFVRRPDDDVVDHAVAAVAALPDPEACAAAGTASRPLPPLGVRARVEVLEPRLATARALAEAGHASEALTAFDALAAEARALGYPPVVADVEHGRARALFVLGEDDAGRAAFQLAAAAAATAGDDAVIADAWLGSLELLGDEGGQPREAFDRLGFAEVAVTRTGDPALREELLRVRSDLELNLGKLAEARADLEAAQASLRARGAERSLAAARITQQLARVLFKLDDNARALALDRQTLAMYTELLGPEHLDVAKLLGNLAMEIDEAGGRDEADAMLRRSLSIKQRSFAGDNPSIAITLHNLAIVADQRGRLAEALELYERAVAIRERTLGPDHALVASTLSALATCYRKLGRPAEALATQQRALAIREKASGADDPALAFPLEGIARSLLDLDRPREALAPARRAVAVLEAKLGAGADRTGSAWEVVGDVLAALHDDAGACAAYARSVAIIEASRGPDSPDLEYGLQRAAECALAGGRRDDALAAADRSLAIIAATATPAWAGGRARLVRAQVLWADRRTRADARVEAERALAVYVGAPASTARDRAAVAAWLAAHR